MCGATGPVGSNYTFCACVQHAAFAVYIKQPEQEEMISMADETPATVDLMTISFMMPVKLDMIANALVGALEGGSTYWLRQIEYVNVPEGEYEKPYYSDPTFWKAGGTAKLSYDDPASGEEDGEQVEKEIGLDEFRGGLIAMSSKYAKHFGDLISENDDAITHDVFVQCVLMGDVVYG